MNRTRLIFFAVVLLALVIVGVSFLLQRFSGDIPNPTAQPISVRVVTAFPAKRKLRAFYRRPQKGGTNG